MSKKWNFPKPENEIHPLQRAWLAGVFDARINIPSTGSRLRYDSTDAEMVRRMHKVLGLGNCVKGKSTLGTRENVTCFQTTNMDDSREFALQVIPFLAPRKLKKLALFIDRIDRNANWKKENPEKAKTPLIDPDMTVNDID